VRELVIVSDDGKKGRSFRAALLACVVAPSLWSMGQSDRTRPIFAMLTCSDAESIPFVRNLQSGKQAALHGGRQVETFECLKSAGYVYAPQRITVGKSVQIAWTIFLPELFRVDPGMVNPSGALFCLLPRHEWLAPVDEPLARELAAKYHVEERWRDGTENAKRLDVCRYVTQIADVFQARLDRHTRCPLIPDRRFAAHVLAAMLDCGAASLASATSYSRDDWGRGSHRYSEEGTADVGLAPGIAVGVSHATLEPLLSECVRAYEQRPEYRRAA